MLTLCLCIGKEQIWMYNNPVHLGDVWCYIPAKLITHGIKFFILLGWLETLISYLWKGIFNAKKLIRDTWCFSAIRKDFEGKLSVDNRPAETEAFVTLFFLHKEIPRWWFPIREVYWTVYCIHEYRLSRRDTHFLYKSNTALLLLIILLCLKYAYSENITTELIVHCITAC